MKPGGTFAGSQALKDRLMSEVGLRDVTNTYGISHFVGMEIHDVGFYDIPWEPGMCFVIEWAVSHEDWSIRFEDVILVTEDGHEWLTGHSPIEPDEIEALMALIDGRKGKRKAGSGQQNLPGGPASGGDVP